MSEFDKNYLGHDLIHLGNGLCYTCSKCNIKIYFANYSKPEHYSKPKRYFINEYLITFYKLTCKEQIIKNIIE